MSTARQKPSPRGRPAEQVQGTHETLRVVCCVLFTDLCRDVTDVFEAFHHEPRQRQKLEAFRVGTLVGYTPSPLVKDFRALKEELEQEGLFEVREGGEKVRRAVSVGLGVCHGPSKGGSGSCGMKEGDVQAKSVTCSRVFCCHIS